jgi:hypothetical protein
MVAVEIEVDAVHDGVLALEELLLECSLRVLFWISDTDDLHLEQRAKLELQGDGLALIVEHVELRRLLDILSPGSSAVVQRSLTASDRHPPTQYRLPGK